MKKLITAASLVLTIAFLAAAIFLYMGSSGAVAQGQSIGYVDSELIIQKYPVARAINDELGMMREQSEQELQRSIQERFGDGDINALPEESQILVQKMIQDADKKYQEQRESLWQEKWTPIVTRIKTTIGQLSQEKGLEIVIEKEAVIYGGLDLTEEVIERLETQ